MISPCRIVAVTLAAVLSLVATSATPASNARAELVQIVRHLGYGAGIHNFKNYVLRGREVDIRAAREDFDLTLSLIDGIKQSDELTSIEKDHLLALRKTVQQYRTNLDKAGELHAENWSISEIDRTLIVDDSAGIAALDALRRKWAWSQFEEIEFQLGYGKAIHNFKNYLLRGRESYHTDALEELLAVESLIVELLGDAGLPSDCRAELQTLSRVAGNYRDYLPLIRRLLDMRRTERELDLAVKVNDGPAKKALAVCRQS